MPAILRETTIAANTTIENILAGSIYEFTRGAGVVSMGVSSAGSITTNIGVGAEVVAEAFVTPILTRYPILPDEFYFNAVVRPADRMAIRAVNATAGGLAYRAVVQITFQG